MGDDLISRKGIIVLDIPKNCYSCRLKKRSSGMSFPEDLACLITGQSIHEYKPNSLNGEKPGWCPIRPLPEKAYHEEYCDNGRYDKGWNECLEEIVREVQNESC